MNQMDYCLKYFSKIIGIENYNDAMDGNNVLKNIPGFPFQESFRVNGVTLKNYYFPGTNAVEKCFISIALILMMDCFLK